MTRFGCVAALALSVAGCKSAEESATPEPPTAEISYECGADGYLTTELFGELQMQLEWSAADLKCAGMPRPNGDGARLRFAGSSSDGRQLAFIIALPDLQRGKTGKEYQSNVTVIEEGNGRFFSTADIDICWTDIDSVEAIGDSDARFAIGGRLYCVAPLTQINGDTDVVIRDLEFRGLLDWNAS